ncbi:MAG: hypothetical protein SFU56_02375 [Capsulimonadales bacterium]|nr:hypothetical protein [Capsulimonadales bacterium]
MGTASMQSSGKPSASSPASAAGGSIDARLVCTRCGLTARELHDTGRMGCSFCYEVFVGMVAQAAAELHHAGDADRPPLILPAGRPTPVPNRAASPWPTRKALPSRPDSAPTHANLPKKS